MSATRTQRNWQASLAWAFLFLFAGAALATWALSRSEGAARFFGVAAVPTEAVREDRSAATVANSPAPAAVEHGRIDDLERRLALVERQSRQEDGAAVRADALLVAFAARRAIERGVSLGYLEPLLSERFGDRNPRAVATVINASRNPVTLDELVDRYRALGPALQRGGPGDSLWSGIKREIGGLVSIHRANRPSPRVDARYERALDHLQQGQVDRALAETMRLPGAEKADEWAADARRYIAVHRALDVLESSALLTAQAS